MPTIEVTNTNAQVDVLHRIERLLKNLRLLLVAGIVAQLAASTPTMPLLWLWVVVFLVLGMVA